MCSLRGQLTPGEGGRMDTFAVGACGARSQWEAGGESGVRRGGQSALLLRPPEACARPMHVSAEPPS